MLKLTTVQTLFKHSKSSIKPISRKWMLVLAFSLPLFFNQVPEAVGQSVDTRTFSSFVDWCSNRDRLEASAQRTVDRLLQVAETSDCNQANEHLLTQTRLSLPGNHGFNPNSTSLTPSAISNLEPLRSLPHITGLDLSYNDISDLSPLQSLPNLRSLRLWYNPVADLTPLQTLTNLTMLELIGTEQVADISPLSSLTQLSRLVIGDSQVSDISAVQYLTQLEVLQIPGNQITDITPLSSLSNLKELTMSGNQVRDVSPLQSLTNLEYLYLCRNPIGNIRVLRPLADRTEILFGAVCPAFDI